MTVTIQLNAEDVVSFYQNNSTHTISKCAKCAVAKGKNCKENKKTKQKKTRYYYYEKTSLMPVHLNKQKK